MFRTEHFEIWNLSPNGVACSGAVDIFNIVGRVKAPASVRAFSYRLNGGPETPIYFTVTGSRTDRLRQPGDFNIDTIALSDLGPDNLLRLRIVHETSGEHQEEIRFRVQAFDQRRPRFRLELADAGAAEEVGQIVDGPWRIGVDPRGRRCLEVAPEDAGYDRIILFGREDWTSGYEVLARLAVTRITGHHNVGLIFKWNPHERGDGTFLPRTWSCGLGYYTSYGKRPGIRIRFGVNVHHDVTGKRHGEYILASRPLTNPWRVLLNKLIRKTKLSRAATELRLDQDYCFRVRVDPARYELTMWEADKPEPSPQLVVDHPIDRLPTGSIGVLAYQVGMRLYELEASPLTDSPALSAAPSPAADTASALSPCGTRTATPV